MDNQANDWTNSFEEFFAGCDNNQYAVTTPRYDIHLPSDDTTKPSSNVSHTPSKDNLFGELSNSHLLEFTRQELASYLIWKACNSLMQTQIHGTV